MPQTIPGPDDAGPSYGFSMRNAGRIAEAVKRFEGYYLNPAPIRARYPVAAGGGALIDVVIGAGGIAAGSYPAPTSGTVTLLQPSTGPGLTGTGAPTTTAYNQWGTAIPAFKYAKGHYRNGYLFIVVWDC